MPAQDEFHITVGEDLTVTIEITPPVPISGWAMSFQASKYTGGTALLTKTCASGFNNVSGINITNAPAGVLVVRIGGDDTSSWCEGSYVYQLQRTNSGYVKTISQGYLIVTR